jgi:serine/threonine protein kinase
MKALILTAGVPCEQIENLKRERNLLDRLRNPCIIRLHFTFQDQDSLYFGLELCPNGVSPCFALENALGRLAGDSVVSSSFWEAVCP